MTVNGEGRNGRNSDNGVNGEGQNSKEIDEGQDGVEENWQVEVREEW